MNREYHKWYSPSLSRDMELLVFGHAGLPVIVFPTSMGRFFDYENRDMIGIIDKRDDKRAADNGFHHRGKRDATDDAIQANLVSVYGK